MEALSKQITNKVNWIEFDKGPFIHYVSTCKGGGGLEIGDFCLFSVHKTCLRRGKGVKKALICAYVIYEWSLRQITIGIDY